MRVAAFCISMLMAGTFSASACDDRFTAEGQEPGNVVAELPRDADGMRDKVTIAEKGSAAKRYDLMCGGSPATCVLTDESNPDSERIGLDEPEEGVLIIGGKTFKPYCE